jgi:hypothetical protein
VRIGSPSSKVIEVDGLSGRRYKPDSSGVYHVPDKRDAKALIEYGGFVVSEMGTTSKAVGFRCEDCGFGSWFKTCSKCGGKAVRE